MQVKMRESILPLPLEGTFRFTPLGLAFCFEPLLIQSQLSLQVMINATGCPAPVLDRNRMDTHKHLSQLIASAIVHNIPTPV